MEIYDLLLHKYIIRIILGDLCKTNGLMKKIDKSLLRIAQGLGIQNLKLMNFEIEWKQSDYLGTSF